MATNTPTTWYQPREFPLLGVREQRKSLRGITHNTHTRTKFRKVRSQFGHTENRTQEYLIETLQCHTIEPPK